MLGVKRERGESGAAWEGCRRWDHHGGAREEGDDEQQDKREGEHRDMCRLAEASRTRQETRIAMCDAEIYSGDLGHCLSNQQRIPRQTSSHRPAKAPPTCINALLHICQRPLGDIHQVSQTPALHKSQVQGDTTNHHHRTNDDVAGGRGGGEGGGCRTSRQIKLDSGVRRRWGIECRVEKCNWGNLGVDRHYADAGCFVTRPGLVLQSHPCHRPCLTSFHSQQIFCHAPLSKA